jgi:PAS domain-containing protein
MQNVYNFFLKRYINNDYPQFVRAKLLFQFCIVTAFFSLFYVAVAHIIHFDVSEKVMSAMAILFCVLAYSMRTPLKISAIAFLYLLFSMVAAIILIIHSGMLYSSIVPWLAFIPLAANLLIGRKSSFFWLTVCFITVFTLVYFTPQRLPAHSGFASEYDVYFYAFVYNGLTGIILVLSMIFQKAKDQYVSLLTEKNELISGFNIELKSKNKEIGAQNEALRKQQEEILTQREFIHVKNRQLLAVQDELNDIIEKLTIAQASLATREAENRGILQAIYSTQLLVGELDLEGRFTRISETTCKFLHADANEIVGKSFLELRKRINITFKGNIRIPDLWQSIIKGHQSNHEMLLEIKGEKYWLKEIFFPIVNDKCETLKVMVIAQDITQLINQKNKIEDLNIELTQKIVEIERQNALLIDQRKEIEKINEEIRKSNEEIRNINASLEGRVFERTRKLEEKNRQLAEYAYINAHLLRGPLCSILGLVHLLENNHKKDRDQLLFHMKKSTFELHDVVKKITKAIEDGSHFDRKLLSDN